LKVEPRIRSECPLDLEDSLSERESQAYAPSQSQAIAHNWATTEVDLPVFRGGNFARARRRKEEIVLTRCGAVQM
jgi:hypothetical protein